MTLEQGFERSLATYGRKAPEQFRIWLLLVLPGAASFRRWRKMTLACKSFMSAVL